MKKIRILSLLLLSAGLAFALGVAAPKISFGAAFQVPGQGNKYVVDTGSSGRIAKPLDLLLGLFETVVSNLRFPNGLACGPDGFLYVDGTQFETGSISLYEVVARYRQDGVGRTVVARWASDDERNLDHVDPVISPDGDLYIGSTNNGIWRINDVINAETFADPQRVISAGDFLSTIEGGPVLVLASDPLLIIEHGPIAGDLLIEVTWRFFNDASTPADESAPFYTKVVRALGPDFATLRDFIVEDPTASYPSAASNSQGEIFLNDFPNGQILRYGPDGDFRGVFAELPSPNQIAVGPDDLVYATNGFFGAGARRGGFFVYNSDGTPVQSADFVMDLRGVAICP